MCVAGNAARMPACRLWETLNKARLTALYAICLQIFRHIAQKSLAIRQYACGISRQSAEKSDYASYAQALFSVSFTYGQLAYTSFSCVITCFLQIGNATILFLLL